MDEPQVIRAAAPFETFYQREYRGVLGLAYALCGSRATAEEVAQESFLAAYRRWDEVGRMDSPEGWVRRVATNRSVSWFRRTLAEGRALVRLGKAVPVPAAPADTVAVWEAVRRLSPRQAEVVVLVYCVGLSYADTAQLLGCGEETVRTHLKRAKPRLAEWLKEDE